MSPSFKPPSLDQLTEVDRADCEYSDGLVEIEGVVSPSSQGGWPHSDEFDVHCFGFAAWRRVGQPVVEKQLTILRPVDPDGDWFSEFPKLSVHRLKVLLSTDDLRAIFACKSDHSADSTGLVSIAAELSKPVVIASNRFGNLTLDRSVGWFQGQAEWNGQTIRLSFHTDENLEISQGLAAAEQIWNEQRSWKTKVDDFAVQELLTVKNDYWLDEDEPALTAEEFKSRMTLESISILPDGSFEFWHNDGDLFYGHAIQIGGSLTAGLTSADIPG